jgi:hypothetical protein
MNEIENLSNVGMHERVQSPRLIERLNLGNFAAAIAGDCNTTATTASICDDGLRIRQSRRRQDACVCGCGGRRQISSDLGKFSGNLVMTS